MLADHDFAPEIERWLAGELSPAEVAALRARVGEGELSRLRCAHEADQAALMRELPPEQFARRVRAQVSARRTERRRRAGIAMGGLAVAAALLLWVTPAEHVHVGSEPPGRDEERLKGLDPELSIFRLNGANVERLVPGGLVSAHEVLQVGYSAAGHRHGVVLSIDGAGAVTLHSPRRASEPALLEPSGHHMLSTSYELDAAPTFERFFLIAADAPLDLERVLAAARTLASAPELAKTQALSLPRGHVQTSFLLRKDAP